MEKDAGIGSITTSGGAHAILIVEDNDTIRTMLEIMLRKLSFEFVAVNDGGKAIELLKERHFDLVIMDWHMPIMDGLSCTQELRAIESAKDTVVIACTAHVSRLEQNKCMASGMDDILHKPFTFEQLAQILKKWLPDAFANTSVPFDHDGNDGAKE